MIFRTTSLLYQCVVNNQESWKCAVEENRRKTLQQRCISTWKTNWEKNSLGQRKNKCRGEKIWVIFSCWLRKGFSSHAEAHLQTQFVCNFNVIAKVHWVELEVKNCLTSQSKNLEEMQLRRNERRRRSHHHNNNGFSQLSHLTIFFSDLCSKFTSECENQKKNLWGHHLFYCVWQAALCVKKMGRRSQDTTLEFLAKKSLIYQSHIMRLA